jgi:hypothetical protein
MHRASWLAVTGAALVALTAVILGFSLTAIHDQQYLASTRSGFIITDTDDDARTWRLLHELASANGADFYHLAVDPTSRDDVRTVKAVVGDGPSHARVFPNGEYARFTASPVTRLERPGGVARGEYLSTLSPAGTAHLVAALTANGVTVQSERTGWGTLLWFAATNSVVPAAAAVAVLATWLCGYARGVSRTRILAVERALGRRGTREKDLCAVGGLALATFGVVVAACAAFLRFGTGSQQIWTFAAVSTIVAVVSGAALIAGGLAGTSSSRATTFLPAYSRWRPWHRALRAAAVTQVVATAATTLLLGSSIGSVMAVHTVLQSRADWSSCETCSVTIFRSTVRNEDFDAAEPGYADAARHLEQSGEALLAWKPGGTTGDDHDPDSSASNTVVVNEPFLREDRIGLPDPLAGRVDVGRWGLLVPDSAHAEVPAVEREWFDWLVFQSSQQPGLAAPTTAPAIATYSSRDVFTYGALDDRSALWSDAPVIVVVPAAANLLPDSSYLAAGSSGELLITGDSLSTRAAFTHAGVPEDVFVVDDYSDQIARGENRARARVLPAALGTTLGFLVVLVTQMLHHRCYTSLHRDRTLLGITSGRTLLRLRWSLWVGQAGINLVAGLLVWVALRSALLPPGATPATVEIAAMALVALVGVSTALSLQHRSSWKKVRADGA